MHFLLITKHKSCRTYVRLTLSRVARESHQVLPSCARSVRIQVGNLRRQRCASRNWIVMYCAHEAAVTGAVHNVSRKQLARYYYGIMFSHGVLYIQWHCVREYLNESLHNKVCRRINAC